MGRGACSVTAASSPWCPCGAPSLVSGRPHPVNHLEMFLRPPPPPPSTPIALNLNVSPGGQSRAGICFMASFRPPRCQSSPVEPHDDCWLNGRLRYARITLAAVTRNGFFSWYTSASPLFDFPRFTFSPYLPISSSLCFPFRVKWVASVIVLIVLHVPGLTFGMASLVALFCGCMDSLKSILTSQDFGSEYEIFCTELSVQWLRIRLWGQSVSRSRRHLV
jgi:hypothetical protein